MYNTQERDEWTKVYLLRPEITKKYLQIIKVNTKVFRLAVGKQQKGSVSLTLSPSFMLTKLLLSEFFQVDDEVRIEIFASNNEARLSFTFSYRIWSRGGWDSITG